MCQVKLIDQSLDVAYDLIFHVQKHQFIRLIEGNEDIYKEIKSIVTLNSILIILWAWFATG